jgi:hypothetical protein
MSEIIISAVIVGQTTCSEMCIKTAFLESQNESVLLATLYIQYYLKANIGDAEFWNGRLEESNRLLDETVASAKRVEKTR